MHSKPAKHKACKDSVLPISRDPQCLSYIFDHLSDAVLVVDGHGAIQLMNPAAEHLLGLNSKASRGRSLNKLIKLMDAESNKLLDISLLIPKTRYSVRKLGPMKLIPARGKEKNVDIAISGLSGCHGKLNGSLIIIHDIKNDISREKELLNRRKIEAIGLVTRFIAEDFNNWLSSINQHATSLSESLLPRTRSHDESLKIIETTEQASQMVRRLTIISRSGTTDSDLKTETVSISDAIQDAVDLLENTLKEKKVYFILNIPEGAPNVMAEHQHLVDCIFNLLANSADAMPNGGTITIEVEDHKTDDHWVTFKVIDTGSGIPRTMIDKVAEPSFSTKNSLGMGLSIVKNSIERWGGRISISSQSDKGTTVKLTLAVSKGQPAVSHSEHNITMSVMIADDDPSFISRSAAIFTEEGISVIDADSPEKAMSIFSKRRSKISIYIIDALMKCSNGNFLANEILNSDPMAMVVLTSGFSKDYIKSAVTSGAKGFIQKPFDKDAVMAVYKRLTDKKSA